MPNQKHTHDERDPHFENDISEDQPLTLDLEFDDGKQVQCEVIGIFEVDEQEYIGLIPLINEESQILLYQFQEDEEGVHLTNIEDDDVFGRVSEAFWDLYGEDEEQEHSHE